ncbi:hypothetical protein DFH07DRAFT_949368 [Mycena maculata]|uniref:Uncharacterized protein n=1 Tax=Mycena maculata TaxID=230809 RepID=A0AAD7KCM2_9AGAR|nr:hypothetical protein DFH07DRAFT_949368 [Mycena maculata]
MPALRICRLNIFDDSDVEGLGGSVIECPLLDTLELLCVGSPAFTLRRMLNRLSLPELRHIKLQGHSDPQEFHLLSFSPFLAVLARLESLNIWTDTFHKASLIDLLRGLPATVQRLKITNVRTWARPTAFDEDTLTLLTISDDLPPCCPALRELILSLFGDLPDAALFRLINSRMTTESCSPLDRVEAEFMREMELDITTGLLPFMDTGLILSLEYNPLAIPEASKPSQGE